MNRTWSRIGIGAFVALVILKFIMYLDKPKTTAQQVREDFENEWHYAKPEVEERLLQEFKNKHMSPCPNLYIKNSIDSENGTLVACTADGVVYYYYQVERYYGGVKSLPADGIEKPTLY